MEELEKLIANMEAKVTAAEKETAVLQEMLDAMQKPVMTAEQADKVYEILCEGFESLADSILDSGEVDYEFGIDYDNRLEVTHAQFNGDASRDIDVVHDEILSMFNVQPPVAKDSKE